MAKAVKKTKATAAGIASTLQPSAAPAADLDRLIHDRMRLGILSALAAETSLSFGELKQVLKATDGNLSVHARKLEDAGYVECRKGFEGRTPRTDYRLTREGRKALAQYVAHMEAIISHVKGG
ncbi:winged helix-turn-helix domain-containing protein [Saccharospirillum impatiens]|uniref:winged helix-turn-helix domain-containing protein n=1 Tax=Saccharospirillum impatiens TaxID=169438 RepID=UPI0003F7D661|nr:transcriptional regulator [Saccharospirillum impatiens]